MLLQSIYSYLEHIPMGYNTQHKYMVYPSTGVLKNDYSLGYSASLSLR